MKALYKVIGCIVVLAVAACLGQACGFFKVPGVDAVVPHVTWAKGDGGSPGEPGGGAEPGSATVETAKAKAERTQLVAESKRRAVAKYPDLAVANTEMNTRFVFRYNWMAKEGNALLQQANWPEQLAEDCAKACKATAKSTKSPAVSPKKMMASTAQ